MVNEIMLGAFQDELEKIARSRHYRHLPLSRAELQKLANLARYVDAAKRRKANAEAVAAGRLIKR